MTETVFVDTSGIYAALDRDDPNHDEAAPTLRSLLTNAATLRTHSYVLVEAAALVQSRLGLRAARLLHDDIVPLLDVRWVDPDLHRRAVSALLAADRRAVSLVDWVSWDVMRDEGISHAFTFDAHFEERGFARARP